ncbi:hypothetical protein ACPVPU_03370 [Sphingomonas sp. CJ99]
MPGRSNPSALVMGDGLAGLGAAILLARHGWSVHLACAPRDRTGHRDHAHLVAHPVLEVLERLAGGALGGWTMGEALIWDANGQRDEGPRPIVAAERLRSALAARAKSVGIVAVQDVLLVPPNKRPGWQWRAADRAGTADLLIDASGLKQAVARLPGIGAITDELSGLDRCWTWTGTNVRPGQSWLIGEQDERGSVMLLNGPDGVQRLTVRGGANAVPCSRQSLDRLLLTAGAEWADRMGNLSLADRPLRHDSPLARRTEIEAADALPPMVRIGDAVLQTAPSLGQGIAQIVEQLAALDAALAGNTPLDALQRPIERLVERRWTGMTMMVGMGRLAA